MDCGLERGTHCHADGVQLWMVGTSETCGKRTPEERQDDDVQTDYNESTDAHCVRIHRGCLPFYLADLHGLI